MSAPQKPIRNVYSAISEICSGQTFAEIKPRLEVAAGDKSWHAAACGAYVVANAMNATGIAAGLDQLGEWCRERV